METGASFNALSAPQAEQRERAFFLVMALALAGTVVAGFGAFLFVGLSTFRSPWWVHVHAVSFMAWIGLYLTQSLLVYRGATDLHRRLGRVGMVLAAWLVLVGLVLTPLTVALDRRPPFFAPGYFLALDWVNIACFGALVYAAIRTRRQTDWHRRLMLCATVCVIAPAWGRLLVLAGTTSIWSNVVALLCYVAVAMVADWFIRARVHPAYFWGFAAIFAMAPAINALGAFAPLNDLALRLTG